ncbi:hypothetical protein GCM10023223_01860 [Stackebrandtia albiflava]
MEGGRHPAVVTGGDAHGGQQDYGVAARGGVAVVAEPLAIAVEEVLLEAGHAAMLLDGNELWSVAARNT